MAKNDYKNLEDQIGDVGGEQLGKLKNPAAYGQKPALNEEEESEMEAFINRSRKHRQAKSDDEPNTPISISQGWIPIDREEMGIRSIFYPESWQFYIRPATVQAIKNWTAIDEERADVLNDVFNDIIKTCVKIDTHEKEGASCAQIRSWDRFWFILKVREYTYSKGQSNIEFVDTCSECNEDITYKLTSQSLFYEFPDEDLIEKYWNNGQWDIDPREYDVEHDPITLYTPTLGKDEAIIEWARQKIQANNKYKLDETFIKFLVWLLPKPIKDMNMLDRTITKIQKEYKDWDLDMFTFMNDVITNITINPSEQLRVVCPECGQEATSTVQFPNGIKVLFEAKTTAKKFGSR